MSKVTPNIAQLPGSRNSNNHPSPLASQRSNQPPPPENQVKTFDQFLERYDGYGPNGDKDGIVTRSEFVEKNVADGVTESFAKRVFDNAIDKNGNRKANREEFDQFSQLDGYDRIFAAYNFSNGAGESDLKWNEFEFWSFYYDNYGANPEADAAADAAWKNLPPKYKTGSFMSREQVIQYIKDNPPTLRTKPPIDDTNPIDTDPITEPVDQNDPRVTDFMNTYDRDGDGIVSKEEFVAVRMEEGLSKSAAIRMYDNSLNDDGSEDEQGNHTISYNEIARFADLDENKRLFEAYDYNNGKTGTISKYEFSHFLSENGYGDLADSSVFNAYWNTMPDEGYRDRDSISLSFENFTSFHENVQPSSPNKDTDPTDPPDGNGEPTDPNTFNTFNIDGQPGWSKEEFGNYVRSLLNDVTNSTVSDSTIDRLWDDLRGDDDIIDEAEFSNIDVNDLIFKAGGYESNPGASNNVPQIILDLVASYDTTGDNEWNYDEFHEYYSSKFPNASDSDSEATWSKINTDKSPYIEAKEIWAYLQEFIADEGEESLPFFRPKDFQTTDSFTNQEISTEFNRFNTLGNENTWNYDEFSSYYKNFFPAASKEELKEELNAAWSHATGGKMSYITLDDFTNHINTYYNTIVLVDGIPEMRPPHPDFNQPVAGPYLPYDPLDGLTPSEEPYNTPFDDDINIDPSVRPPINQPNEAKFSENFDNLENKRNNKTNAFGLSKLGIKNFGREFIEQVENALYGDDASKKDGLLTKEEILEAASLSIVEIDENGMLVWSPEPTENIAVNPATPIPGTLEDTLNRLFPNGNEIDQQTATSIGLGEIFYLELRVYGIENHTKNGNDRLSRAEIEILLDQNAITFNPDTGMFSVVS